MQEQQRQLQVLQAHSSLRGDDGDVFSCNVSCGPIYPTYRYKHFGKLTCSVAQAVAVALA